MKTKCKNCKNKIGGNMKNLKAFPNVCNNVAHTYADPTMEVVVG